MRGRIGASIAMWAWLLACPASRAETLTVHRCIAADGAVTLQDVPCPPQSRSETRTLVRPRETAPAALTAPPVAPPAEADLPAEPPPPVVRRTPAPRFECLRPDGSTYESTDGAGQPRWVPLWTLGVDPRAPARTFGRTGARPEPRPAFRPAAPDTPPPGGALGPGVWIADACRLLAVHEICARRGDAAEALARRARNVGTGEAARLREERRALLQQLAEEC